MRSGRLAVVSGLVLIVAGTGACGAPAGMAGISTRPPVPPADATSAEKAAGQAHAAAATVTPAGGSADVQEPTAVPAPSAGEPVLVPPPRLSPYTYVFPVKNCETRYERTSSAPPGATIWADRGCAFVAPVDGVVHEVNTQDRWSPATDRGPDREGRFVTLLGVDGVLYLGGHLESVAAGITPGKRVKAGQLLGRVGNSGAARTGASNLYFAISWKTTPTAWWVRRGMVRPWPYLDAWDDGNPTYSPRAAVRALRKRLGVRPPCTVRCTGATPSWSRPTPRPSPKPKTKPKPSPEPILINPNDPLLD